MPELQVSAGPSRAEAGAARARSPRTTAGLAGGLYLASAVPAGLSVAVLTKLVVRGDADATASRILGAEGLFRAGFVVDLVGILFYVAAVLFLAELLRPAGRSLARLFLAFALIGSGIQALSAVQDLTALQLLKGGAASGAMAAEPLRALAYAHLRLHWLTYDVALVFFAAATLVMAWLLLRAAFLPRLFGLLVAIDGMGYLVASLGTFLAPAFVARLYPFVPMVTALGAEVPLMLWLVVRGVDAARWQTQATEARP